MASGAASSDVDRPRQLHQEWFPWNPPMAFDLSNVVPKVLHDLQNATFLDSPPGSNPPIKKSQAIPQENLTVFNIDSPFRSSIINDAYKFLQSVEDIDRPCIEMLQKHVSHNARLRCVYKLLRAADELLLRPCTLHLGINCFDRYLAGNRVGVKNLYFVGLTCLMIAFQELECRTDVNLRAYVKLTKNRYSMEEFIATKEQILDYLGSNKVNVPTAQTFMNRFVKAALAGRKHPMHLKYLKIMASYLADVSVLSLTMLGYKPSLVATSCVVLALYILNALEEPWSATLQHYTAYEPALARDCALKLHPFACRINRADLKVFRKKYNLISK